ncbi:hypothetical protein ACS0TY_001371 [Phlomoides rotata]
MDYNDSDYEGQNLHLTGEESSKVSVLRPFALPKFDFDDSLHGHLRFDSLVENEVFLGIPSQEDNHWIEDYSRGGSGIEFSSRAAESCALPRHINVWSEATSSESVEMLLKAVGQEEMVPGENVEQSDPGDQLVSTTGQMVDSLRQDFKVDDAGNLSVSPVEVGRFFSRLNQRAGEDVCPEHTLQAQETSSSGTDVNNKDGSITMTIENSIISMEGANNYQLETCGSVDESLSNQMQESLAVLGEEIENSESASQNIDVSVREPVNQDKISDISLISSSCKDKGISDPDDREERCNENDPKLIGIASETDNIEKDCAHEFPSGLHSPKDHVLETSIKISGDASSIAEVEKSISTGAGRNKIAFVLEPADCIQHSTVSGTKSKQLSESPSILHEKPLQGEGEIKRIDSVTSPLYDDNATKLVGVILSSDEHKSRVGNDDISPNNNNSLEAPCPTSESSLLPEVLHNPSEKGGDYNTNRAEDVTRNSRGSNVSGECCGVKSLTEDMKDARYTTATSKENIVDEDHFTPPLVTGGMNMCTEYIVPMQVDAPKSNQDVLSHGREGEELPHDSQKMERDDTEKEVSSACPAEGDTVEKTSGLQSNISTMNYPVLNTDVEDTKLAASCVEGDGLVDSQEHNPTPCDLGHGDQSKENEVEAGKQPSPSVPKEAFESIVLAPAIKTGKGTVHGPAAGEMNTSHQSVSFLETSSVTMPNESSKELNKNIVNSADTSIVQEAGVESAPTKEPMEAETERNIGTNSALSVIGCTVEIGKSNKQPIPDASCTDLSQSQANKQAPLKSNNGENIGKVLTTSENSGVNNDPSKEEGTFTFDIRHLGTQPAEDSGKDLQSFPRLQACKLSSTGESFPSVSSGSQMEQMVVKETSHVSSSTPGVCPPSGSLRSPVERKSRRGCGNKSGKGSSKKGNLVKEIFPLKQTEKGDKSPLLLSSSGTGQLMAFESGVKPRGAVSIPTSSLPDLNTSAPSSVFFQQPFTDLQQVQLRAQIFVYGSLIQGTAPDEACMVSAFDGGRSVWERSWRACVDKLHGQKSQGSNTGTPVPSRSDQINKQGFPQTEVLSSSAGRASNKAIQSPVPLIPLSSPLWSISTPAGETLPPSSMARGAVTDYQAVSPLNPYQTPPLRNYVAHTTWLSQAQAPPAPFPVPWLSSSQSSSFEISTSYPTFPNTELVKKTPIKESSLPIASGAKHVTPIPGTHTESSTMLPVASPLDLKKGKVSTGPTADTKTRKRKKSSGAEDVGQISVTSSLSETVSAHTVTNNLSNKSPAGENLSQISLIAQNQMGSLSSPVVGSYFSTSVALPTPSSYLSKGNTNQAFSVVLPSFSTGDLNKGDLITDKRTLKLEGFSEVEEAKLQAQEAAAHAAAAVSKCEDVWSHLYQQKSSGLTSDNESKLASAAVAIAAAASVAKAAAAAAKIASNAAVQAKQMADEAVTIPGTLSTSVYDSNLVYSSRNLVNVSPGSILKGGDRNNAPSLAISSAREAARKRIEAASAATRHAENLDAIVKAAELAAEAVAHAGKVVAMGDPFSLSALAEAGPNNYWKVSLPGSTSVDMNKNKSVSNNAEEVPNVYNQHEGPDKDMRVTSHAVNPIETELSRNVGDPVTLEENLINSVKHGGDNSKPNNDTNVSDSAKTAVVSDTETESRSPFLATSIKEGSHVEVLKDHDDLKKAWFSASVLTLKDGEALVCYNGLQSGEGSEQLKEWVSLDSKDGNIPKVRIPHPMTTMLFEGTRKRRRAAVKDYTWSVGDRVDAWVRNCWCEGIVAEKNKKDATALSIHFPAQGETLDVKMWHLRPSLVWSDGEWIEWSKPRQEGDSQGDTPVEKRPKLGSTSTEVKGKAQMAKNINFVEVERNEEPKLPLSANEKVFNIGSTREGNKPNMVRTIPSGLEKERPRVIFGVPKPGKKRKFMEVSKHYVSDRTAKTNVPSDSVKLAKLLMPQGSGSRGFRNSSNLDFKEKQVADSKPRTLKSGKPPSIPSRTLSRKDNSTSSRPSARDAAVFEHSAKGSISNDENESSEQNLADTGETSVGTMVFSSQVLPRKKASRNTRSERLNQGKLAPARGKSAKDEVAEKLISEVAEPRRSNRRIQPTSRLLEGLQSSLIISKIPSSSSSQDKGHRNVNKSSARGNSNRG